MPLSLTQTFTEPVAGILTENANLPIGLTRSGACDRQSARLLTSSSPAALFPNARHPEAAVSGLLLLLGCWEESHNLSQDVSSPEGSYWHAIAHRIQPDSSNAGYWFRRVGDHPIFGPLHQSAAKILQAEPAVPWTLKPAWDPFLFIQWCEEARSTADPDKTNVALQIQMAEWELLFSWCAASVNAPPEAL